MVSAIQRDIERLRTATGGGRGPGGECPECGWGGGDDFGPNDTYEVTWVDPVGPEDKNEFCETCGRQLVIDLTWGDEHL